ncbi:DEAD/DEAH box helicase [Ferrimonas sp. YFM]|uniref:DEAD/DEAH box helicase n=1 Tax=Ferrimonas sp. YFM TaxID=3028878 RepID=UPI0025732A34|nr:DEAD/DEAH box helicase [Ferrimonas sp. YFM]BDY05255.1 RNA helicase [Ferrimonas sp. YFM]
MSFSSLGLSAPLVDAVAEAGYSEPTSIQQKAIPVVLRGDNLIAAAQTGTGKTASFVLPILQQLSQGSRGRKKRVRALIIAPTRELVVQVAESVERYGRHLPLTCLAMYGGVDIEPQRQALLDGVDLLVATPGRLLDMYSRRAIHFDEVEMLVLDEADKMLDMGFIDDINDIVTKLPTERQSLLFSATLSKKVRALAKSAISDAVEISIAASQASKATISQWLTTVDKDKKSALLSHLIQTAPWNQALIFIETKHGAAKLVSQLAKRGIEADCIHSGRTQAVREQILADFKAGTIRYLVATGVAARGIDIDNLERVVNYDLPFPADEYVHRIGRTGRAGALGEAVSLVSKDDFKNLCMIESRLNHLIERREVEGFAPRKAVPISILNYVPKAKRQAVKPKS